jgi:threonine dehydratase
MRESTQWKIAIAFESMRTVERAETPAEAEGLLPTIEDLEEARFLCQRFARAGLREVPLVPFGDPSARTWLALESMQVTGSFKVRGAMFAIARRLLAFRRAHGELPFSVIAVSAGNHGAGVAYAAKHLGVSAEVVVPRDAPETKVRKIEAAGAVVIRSAAPGYDAAEREAMEIARARGALLLSPYDDIDVLVGNGASLGFEITRALGRVPAVVYCPIGGGGLATGLACALRHEASLAQPRVISVQSEASCAFALSLERGHAVTELPPQATLAEGLEGGISERGFARARAVLDRVVVVAESEIQEAIRFAVRELGLVIEGSAAVALVPLLATAFTPAMGDTVVVLTGRNIDADRLKRVC